MQESCRLLGPLSLSIQCFLGLISIMSLVVKRNYENPRRTWRIWFYDVSKQVFGAFCLHMLNLLASILKSKKLFISAKKPRIPANDDECSWYFINLLMDTTVGVPLLWCALFLLYAILNHFKVKHIESGNYGNPPLFRSFLKQFGIFIVALVMMKIMLFSIVWLFPVFYDFSDWVLSWLDYWPDLQVVVVMFVSPVVLNCFQYFCVDNIIKFPGDAESSVFDGYTSYGSI